MSITRRQFGALVGSAACGFAASADEPPQANLGLLIYSFGIRARAEKDGNFSDPLKFIPFAKERGANAVQVALGAKPEADATAIRRAAEKAGVHVEGIVSPPIDDRADLDRFEAELKTAKLCGARVVRTVMPGGGRRYEVFDKPEHYASFAKRAKETLERAEPVAEKHDMRLAVENHKDFRTDELGGLMRHLSSKFVGVCVDTGNSIALLEDPARTMEDLAPFALTVHLKDMALEEAPDGFRLAEVPLGTGALDLKSVVETIRKGAPRVRFQLEMITRDPLSVPCLTEKYWATLDRVPGRDLARTLALVRKHARKEPLPRVSKMTLIEQLDAENANVRKSFEFAAKSKLFS
jgi:3-oxoisoapionate decarboxylase